jgi:site-specific DNA recombinase
VSNTRNGTPARPQTVRCAIYTRKSTEEGLDQEFNSLDAQREAAQAYIASQQHEGWCGLPQRYDDGGCTGGNLERPALQRLLADVAAGQIDCVLVYKVDRLSRSLLDFAQLMASFEAHRVAFVSITQQFNTATSMGRLVLNILLSFAQFERELIAERTRDKIAAARRKGKWIGGLPPLGYTVDPRGPRLRVHEKEAERVRAIFALYLEQPALLRVVGELARRGWVTKRWQTRKGRWRGGQPFTKTSLYRLLTSVLYIGKIRYQNELHEGEHPGILEPAVWQQVQELLEQHGPGRAKGPRSRCWALLRGLLHCQPCGCLMTPTYASRNGRQRYRYYLCLHAAQRGRAVCPSPSVSAAAIEQVVVEQLQRLTHDPERTPEQRHVLAPFAEPAAWQALSTEEQTRTLGRVLQRVDHDPTQGKITLTFRPLGSPHEEHQP